MDGRGARGRSDRASPTRRRLERAGRLRVSATRPPRDAEPRARRSRVFPFIRWQGRLLTAPRDRATRYYIASTSARGGAATRACEHLAGALARYPFFTYCRPQRDPAFALIRSDVTFVEHVNA